MSPAQLLVAALAMMAGTVIQGSIGFGTNLVAAPILAIINPDLVPVPVILASFVFNVLVARRDRGEGPWQAMRLPLVGSVPASVAGAAAVAAISQRGLGVLFGVLVLIGVALSVSGRHPRQTPRTLVAAGAASGFMATTTGIGGPPMALLFQRERGPQLRAVAGPLLRRRLGGVVHLLLIFGQVSWADFGRAAVLIPGGLVGLLAVEARGPPTRPRLRPSRRAGRLGHLGLRGAGAGPGLSGRARSARVVLGRLGQGPQLVEHEIGQVVEVGHQLAARRPDRSRACRSRTAR